MSESNITRRGFLGHAAGAYAATAIVGGTAVAVSDLQNLDLMKAYNQWLHMERRLLMMEAFPFECASLVHQSTAAECFHFPSERSWREQPQPSTRAGLVLSSVGVKI